MISIEKVSKTYKGAGRPALDSVSIEIEKGDFVFLVGASGSGKSSLLRMMLREDVPSKGSIHVLGENLITIPARRVPYFRRSIGMVFQDFRLLPNKTVAQNVAFCLEVIGKSPAFIAEAVPAVLKLVGLDGKMERYPNELSGGEQQRVALARAIVNKPQLLLADEPTGALDSKTSEAVIRALRKRIDAGIGGILVTHDAKLAAWADRILVIRDGVIVDEVSNDITPEKFGA